MFWERVTSLFHSSKGKRAELFLKNLERLPLSHTCYIQWYLDQKEKQIEFQVLTSPFSFVFRYENKFHLHGKKAWALFDKISWFKTNNVLLFSDPNFWEKIQTRFGNFRSLETNEKTNTFNTYSTYRLSIETFKPQWKESSAIIRFPEKNFSLPKRYRHLNDGISYGYVKNEEVLSFAAAPHILQKGKISFAIIRGIETKLLERKQGYSEITVTKLCQHLLAELLIREIFLWVEETNQPAINLYKKLGFIKDKTIYATFCDLS